MIKKRRVLIPTDFTVRSLQVVIDYLGQVYEQTADKQLELVLIHGHKIGDSITELLGFPQEDFLNKAYKEDFLTACEIIKHRFEDKVIEIYADLLSSNNDYYIRNYLKGNKITAVVLPLNFNYTKVFQRSFCVLNVLQKNSLKLGIPITENLNEYAAAPKKDSPDSIENIFFRKDLNNATY